MGQKAKNAGKKKNIYFNPQPSKEYGDMNDYKRKQNEIWLDNTLKNIKIGGIWLYYDYQQVYEIILDNGVVKFSSDCEGARILSEIVSSEYFNSKFVLK